MVSLASDVRLRTHGCLCCQEARLSDLVTCGSRAAGLGMDGCCCGGFSSSLPVCAVARSGVQLERPQPRSGEDERAGRRQAAADDRERGRAFWDLGCRGRVGWVVSPGDVLAGGVVSHAPIRHRAGQRDAMTVTSGGPGCSVRSSSAAWGPAHAKTRAHPGPGDPSGLVGVPPLAAASRW
jgi:hypothetical protein